MSGPYDDILSLPHHVSPTRSRMGRAQRAAQFSPFAALTGYDAAIREEGRLTQPQRPLSEDQQAELNRRLHQLLPLLPQQPLVSVTYFQPDDKKSGGDYVTVVKPLKRINPVARVLVMADSQEIGLDQVAQLEHLPDGKT